MASSDFPQRYLDPEYQQTHRDLHSSSLLRPFEPVLPPGVNQKDFELAIKELVGVLGKDGVFTGKALEDYVDPYELWENEGKRKAPSAAVCPRSIDEVKSVLEVATKFKIPLWTFSWGKNLGYGGPAPVVNGSIALDLHRLNKIVEVNDKYSYAVVEPGVTFTDLYNYCAEHKLRVWPSVPSLGWGSVIGNTLDRGTGFTPTATHHQHIAGLEVLLADGDVVRTGQFAISNSQAAHLSKFTFGPSIEGLFLQSNLGIVTKLGIWLTPQPQAYMSCSFDMPSFEDIETMVNVFSPLRRNGVLPNTVYISNVIEWTGLLGKRAELWKEKGPIPAWRVAELQKELDMGYWNAKFGLYGPKGVIQAQFDELKRITEDKAPSGRLRGHIFSGESNELLEATTVPEPHGGFFVGMPSLWSLPMVKWRLPVDGSGVGAHCDYSPIIPSDGKTIMDWAKATRRIAEKEGYDLFCDFFMHERHVIFVSLLAYDKADAEHRRAVDAIFHGLHQEGKERGFSEYRCHVNHMDLVADLYDFNDHAYRRFVEKLKDTLDPEGILSPGKQGIWPRRFRENRPASRAFL